MRYTKLEQLPQSEAERWNSAAIIEGYPQRHIAYDFSITRGVASATLEQFLEEVSERLARWQQGNYCICEAAQVVGDSTPEVDAIAFCKQMERACHEGDLILRLNGVPIKPGELDGRSLFNKIVRRSDVNDWLLKSGAGFELPSEGQLNINPSVAAVRLANDALTPRPSIHKLRVNSLDGAIDKAIAQAGSLSSSAVYLSLRDLALDGERPFTGIVVGDTLLYTNDNNEPDKFTKGALEGRLKRRKKLAAVGD